MKYLRQFGIILGVTCAGEVLKYFIPLSVPGSIYGLILMFVLLFTGILKVEHVKETGEFLIEIMPLMFIPAGVGLLTSSVLTCTYTSNVVDIFACPIRYCNLSFLRKSITET